MDLLLFYQKSSYCQVVVKPSVQRAGCSRDPGSATVIVEQLPSGQAKSFLTPDFQVCTTITDFRRRSHGRRFSDFSYWPGMTVNENKNVTIAFPRHSSGQDARRPIIVRTPVPTDLPPNHILLKVDRFGFSANNITYQALGEAPHFRSDISSHQAIDCPPHLCKPQILRFSSCARRERCASITRHSWARSSLGIWNRCEVVPPSCPRRRTRVWVSRSNSVPDSPSISH